MIKAIFFDFDGVLTLDKNGWYTTCINIHKETKIDLERLITCYRLHSEELNLGNLSHKKIWANFCKCIGRKVDIKILKKAFLDTPLNKEMFNLAKKLKKTL